MCFFRQTFFRYIYTAQVNDKNKINNIQVWLWNSSCNVRWNNVMKICRSPIGLLYIIKKRIRFTKGEMLATERYRGLRHSLCTRTLILCSYSCCVATRTLTEPTRDHLLLKHKYRCDSSANIDSRMLKSRDFTVRFSVTKEKNNEHTF